MDIDDVAIGDATEAENAGTLSRILVPLQEEKSSDQVGKIEIQCLRVEVPQPSLFRKNLRPAQWQMKPLVGSLFLQHGKNSTDSLV